MNDGLSEKVALVTGAAGAIGRAICQTLAAHGARIAATDVAAEGLSETVRLLGDGHEAIAADLREVLEIETLASTVVERFGRLDVLVNNAATIVTRKIVDCSEADYDEVMTVNVKAPFFAIRAAIPRMLANGGGAIVNIASNSGLNGLPEQSVYCTSKGALVQMTRQVAVDYAAQGIRCNAVCPGTIETPFLDRFLATLDAPDEVRQWIIDRHPIGRLGTPGEVAAAVAFLASPAASFIHGAIISVDGGYVAA